MKRILIGFLMWAAIAATVFELIFTVAQRHISIQPEIASAYVILCFAAAILIIADCLLTLRSLNLYKVKAKLDIEELIEKEKSRFDSIFNYDMNGIVLLGLDGKCLRVNKAFCELLGYDQQDSLSLNYYHLITKDDFLRLQEQLQKLLDDSLQVYRADMQCVKKNNEYIWVAASLSVIRDMQNKPQMFILQLQNKTLQKQAEERLHHMAYHDALTGLDNRNKLEQNLNQALASAKRTNESFGVIYLDIDKFKEINDSIGHEAGDTFLQIIADRLRSTVRNTDMIARVGGDEFVILIHDVKKTESVAVIAIKLLESISKPLVINGKEVYGSTSIGISLYPYDGHTIAEIMNNADLALYRAKEQGRNCYQFFTTQMTQKAQDRLALLSAIENAIIRDEFELYYQPQMNLKSRQIVGVEALLRWKNPHYNVISPEEIITLSEETGLIVPVSKWIIKTACQQLKKWHDMGMTNLQLAINLTGRPFRQPGFTDEMLVILHSAGLSPSSLNVEVTEATIMENPDELIRNLYMLKDIGVNVVIDDFGMGYWSLNNLRRLPVNKIKIDNSFIQQIATDKSSRDITSAIIAMANKLDIITVAEAVETKQQYDFLVKEGCQEIQGYYITQPLPASAITKFLQHPIPAAEQITIRDVT